MAPGPAEHETDPADETRVGSSDAPGAVDVHDGTAPGTGPSAGTAGDEHTEPDDRAGERPAAAARQTALAEAIGGPRGLVDTGLPAIVFVVANALGGLTPAILSAVGVGLVLVVVRLYRKETLQQAIAGFFGLAIAAFFAWRTGEASGFFLPGIIYQVLLAVVAVISLVVGRPYVGYVLAALDPKYTHWRSSRPLRRAMSVATVLWGGIFAARAVVQGFLYLNDRVGWLATAKIVMGWPLFAIGLAITYWLARRAAPETRH
jgi:hypothetical protein